MRMSPWGVGGGGNLENDVLKIHRFKNEQLVGWEEEGEEWV